MSAAPYSVPAARWGAAWATDNSSIPCSKTAFFDAFLSFHMGTTAEKSATKWGVTERSGRVRLSSQQKTAAALQSAGLPMRSFPFP